MSHDIQSLHDRVIDESATEYGISPLHCLIRTFEYVLHLGYKSDSKKHRVSGEEDKLKVKLKKEHIQREMKDKLGLVVDQPKVGFGNSNTGNLARRAFEKSSEFSEITGISEELVIRLRTLLKAVSSGYKIDTEKFKAYCDETFEYIMSEYP